MSELLRFSDVQALGQAPLSAPIAASPAELCEECVGSGGWYRYEPALEPAPGVMYLSCVHCRGTGRAAGAPA